MKIAVKQIDNFSFTYNSTGHLLVPYNIAIITAMKTVLKVKPLDVQRQC